jgi:hypothetical protein
MKGLTKKVQDAGIDIASTFVPYSASRNAKPGATIEDMSLNWKVTFSKDGESFTADYSQGIGHCPSYKFTNRITKEYATSIKAECETGHEAKLSAAGQLTYHAMITLWPDEVIECLIMDSSVLEQPNFERWADDYGYDKDSRKAEAIYTECLKQSQGMQAVFGYELIEELRTLMMDDED